MGEKGLGLGQNAISKIAFLNLNVFYTIVFLDTNALPLYFSDVGPSVPQDNTTKPAQLVFSAWEDMTHVSTPDPHPQLNKKN